MTPQEHRARKAARLERQAQLAALLDSAYARGKTPTYRRGLLKRYILETNLADPLAGFEIFRSLGVDAGSVGAIIRATVALELVKATLDQGLTPEQRFHLIDFFKVVRDEAMNLCQGFIADVTRLDDEGSE